MKPFVIIGLAMAIVVATTAACCFASIPPAMAAGSDHCHSQAPSDAQNSDEPLSCCSSATDTTAILNEGNTLRTFDTVTAAMLPGVDQASSTVEIHVSSADIYQLPPGRHGFLHDLSILRI
jgi:hypothetical protein